MKVLGFDMPSPDYSPFKSIKNYLKMIFLF